MGIRAKWEDGKSGEVDVKLGTWEDGKMAKWEVSITQKVWQNGKMENWKMAKLDVKMGSKQNGKRLNEYGKMGRWEIGKWQNGMSKWENFDMEN